MAGAAEAVDPGAVLRRPTISVDELAMVLDVGRNQAYAAVRSGQVRSIRVGRRIRVPSAAVRELLGGDS